MTTIRDFLLINMITLYMKSENIQREDETMSTENTERVHRVNHPFKSLKHKNFGYYWFGMCISLIGTWMQNIAQPWLAYELTQSPFLLSLIGALQFTPILLFSLVAGVYVDRFPKKKILFFTQSASALIALTLALLVWSHQIQYWHILVMATLLGLVNVLDMPTRQSFVIELVGKEDLMNAIAMNSMAFNVARVIGPSIAGLIMGFFGVGICFFINAISYMAVIFGLFFVKPIAIEKVKRVTGSVWEEIKGGVAYIFKKPILVNTLLIILIIGIFIPNFSVLVPVYAKEALQQDEKTFGLLMSCMGIGSFFGAMFIATLSKDGPNRWVVRNFPWIASGLMAMIGLMNHFVTAGLLLALTGFVFVAFASSANSTMQLNASDEFRGRVMSVYTLVFAGSTPFGNMFAGATSEFFGPKGGFIACGLSALILLGLAMLYHRRHSLKS